MTQKLHPTLERVTDRIRRRSEASRQSYLEQIRQAAERGRGQSRLSCSNLAHVAAAGETDQASLLAGSQPNVAIVTAYNDMLSAHQPFATFPPKIKLALRAAGATGQVAGGVPAMCDGVTQGQAGMELSLFSRDVIALSTAVALSHDVFDAMILLGICDKIVPGQLIGALSFGHLPTIFIPAGPMPSGLSNPEKARARELYTENKISRAEMLAVEAKAYHAPGTCTFYGTANSNQMFMEILGLHLPGASFVNPGTPMRDAMTHAAARRIAAIAGSENKLPLGEMIDERSIVNAVVGLLATGGSTNHTIHLVAIARAGGIFLDWSDFDELSSAVPLLTRIYPNGVADVNHFDRAGGMSFLIGELLDAGLLHADAQTVTGSGLETYRQAARLGDDGLEWTSAADQSHDREILRPADDPFQPTGGIRLLRGNLGRAILKTSALPADRLSVEAPARVFDSQGEFRRAFEQGELDRDFVAVVRFQGPRANGMPELHQLMTPLSVLQQRGRRVALVTDGRLSGASGKVPAAIHTSPETLDGGPLGKLRDGDPVTLDAATGVLEAKVEAGEWQRRQSVSANLAGHHQGLGRELFAGFRERVTSAEEGASSLLSALAPRIDLESATGREMVAEVDGS